MAEGARPLQEDLRSGCTAADRAAEKNWIRSSGMTEPKTKAPRPSSIVRTKSPLRRRRPGQRTEGRDEFSERRAGRACASRPIILRSVAYPTAARPGSSFDTEAWANIGVVTDWSQNCGHLDELSCGSKKGLGPKNPALLSTIFQEIQKQSREVQNLSKAGDASGHNFAVSRVRQCPAPIGFSRNIFRLIHVQQWLGIVENGC